uniref:nucleoporin nup211-like n=1 Tax=Erigeron canadensis TaxID=72917 RepID=UPI001CB9BFAC|nr:nucleoporin nup211-like [Erigeron canadensis]
MEEEMEVSEGSPTAGSGGGNGENEFVHIESVINQDEHLEQDDGVVVTGVDVVQDELPDVRTHEDAGHDEFVDCPDDLVSSESRSPSVRSKLRQHPFGDGTEDIQQTVAESEKEIAPQDYEEERKVLVKEVSNLHHQLKALSKQQSLTDRNDGGFPGNQLASETEEDDNKSILPVREMVNECSKFIELSLNERSRAEGTISELYATLHMKDKEIEDLMMRVNEQSASQDDVISSNEMLSVETTTDRILSSLAITFGEAELPDTSVSGKISYLENSTFFLLEKYNYFLSEAQMLGHCLVEVNSGFDMQNGMETVFSSVREELVGLKRKEFELNDKYTHLEHQHGQLMEQLDKNRETIELLNAEIGKLKGEVEQEKTRYSNTKEKLSMAVTKGKGLVQQRDTLKQSVAEKTSELERCLIELQVKSAALEAAELRSGELSQTHILANSLQEALSQRDMVLEQCMEIISQGLPDATQFPNLETRVSWLLESYNHAKDQYIKLQDENNAIKVDASIQIDRLTASLLAETQEKYHLKEELEEMTCKYEQRLEDSTESSPVDKEVLEKIQTQMYVRDLESKLYEQILDSEMDNQSKVREEHRVLEDERNSSQINLQRSEEKASLLREKLSMAVKKGKGLVQERENMKQQIAEKNAQTEALMVDFQKQESALGDCRDQIAKLESERDQIGQYLAQSNMILQQIIETIDGSNIDFQVDIEDPVDKVKWFAAFLSECQVAKGQAEQELGDFKDEAALLVNKLTDALTTIKSLEDTSSVLEKNVSELTQEKQELESSKSHAEQEVEIIKEEVNKLNNKLVEALKTLKSLEDKLASSEKFISQLNEEKKELEIARCHLEDELHKATEEAASQTSKFQDAVSLAENNISRLMNEKEEAQMEVQKVKEEVSSNISNLADARETIKFLEDALSVLKMNASRFSEENEKAVDSRTVLESEMKNLREEAEHEISTLKNELSTCRQELEAKHDKSSPELSSFFGNLQVILKDESLLFLFKQSFEKKVKSLEEIDCLLKDMKDNFDSKQLLDPAAIEETFLSPTSLPTAFNNDWNTGLIDVEFNAEDTEDIVSYAGKTLDNLNAKNQILVDQFGSFSRLLDDIIVSLLKKLDAIKHTLPFVVQQTKTLQQDAQNMQMDKQIQDNRVLMLEHDIKVLLSVCADVTKDLKLHLECNILQTDPTIELEKSNPRLVEEVAEADVKVAANELCFASRTVQWLIKQHVSVNENLSATIEQLQAELDKVTLMHDKSKEVIEGLQGELQKTRSVCEKVEEENDASQRRVFELETELEASGSMCNEMSSELNELKRQLSAESSVKYHEEDIKNSLLSASQMKALFDKIDGIAIPFPNLMEGDIQPEHLDSVKKLFYIVDNVNELLDQLTLLTRAKEDLRKTLSKQALEFDHLKGEYKDGLQNIIQTVGGDEFVGVKKPSDVAVLLPVLERLVQGIISDRDNSRFKLVETQKTADELSSKVKSLEDFIQKRAGGADTIQERSVFEGPSLPAGSEISEIDDQVPVGKVGLPLVPSAAQMRSLRKGSNDQLAITIDSESDRLLDKVETVEDKGHIFKSLHTSGLVPVQGKMIADRLDGIWVSGGQALMRRPRARLGLIAYWLVLHLWLLGTIL